MRLDANAVDSDPPDSANQQRAETPGGRGELGPSHDIA